ncbi:MAG: HAD-IIIA family hydrolase [Bacteroidetes bacterium]|nr:HAD-IIIA family hydrolase [Bacteroidota bacterium]
MLSELKDIRLIVLDVDGVLTNGDVHITEDGNLLRTMNIKDGYALRRAVDSGLKIVVISGGTSEGVRIRLNKLGVTDVFLGVKDKVGSFNSYLEQNNLSVHQSLMMGDDLPDLELMQMVKFPACPADAVSEIKEISRYISPFSGGKGCVRDILEKVMKLQNIW